MKILTKKKQKEVLARMVANAIIATDALIESKEKLAQGLMSTMDNLREASSIIGGIEGVKYATTEYDKGFEILMERIATNGINNENTTRN